MILLTLFLTLGCPDTIIVNESNESFGTELDMQSLKGAKKRCKEIYQDAPCLKTFIKKEPQVYHAICGKES